MKTQVFFLFVFMVLALPVCGQLNAVYNHLRPGDVLIKQQVEFVDPGQSGANRLWDFSKLKTIDDEYSLIYSIAPLEGDSVYIMGDKRFPKEAISENELIVGTEHNTMYYYRLTNDSLLQVGHENPTVKLEYIVPMMLMKFPLNYGQTISSVYKSKGIYSSTVDMQSEGRMLTSADAYGKMILPIGDTLRSVLRVKIVQTIFDNSSGAGDMEITDTPENKGVQLETCRWYSKGYRYPVFETIRSINLNDMSEIFSTGFFFSPQDHFYLDTDPENSALLEELWRETEKAQENQPNDPAIRTVALEDLLTCKIYPNPVISQLSLEYELKQNATVSFDLYSIEGLPVKRIKAQQKAAGVYFETLDCSTIRPNNYVLRITVNNLFVNEIIIKK